MIVKLTVIKLGVAFSYLHIYTYFYVKIDPLLLPYSTSRFWSRTNFIFPYLRMCLHQFQLFRSIDFSEEDFERFTKYIFLCKMSTPTQYPLPTPEILNLSYLRMISSFLGNGFQKDEFLKIYTEFAYLLVIFPQKSVWSLI